MNQSAVLSISIATGIYRHLQISLKATLYELHEAIIESIGFDDDHLHAFYMSNKAWDLMTEYITPRAEVAEGLGFTDEIHLEAFNLDTGSQFMYIYDFGDEWRMKIKVLRLVDTPTDKPRLIKSKGAVEQYPDWD